MATKRKFEELDSQEITGYIHDVSDVKTAATSATRYFYGKVQTEHDSFLRFVSFSPEKQTTMKSAETTKSPVKITQCIIQPKGDSKEVIIKKQSQVSVCRKLNFERAKKKEDAPPKFIPIGEIETANIMCSVKAKVVSVSTSSLISTKYGQRYVQKVSIVDGTKSMTLNLWQQHVNKVEPQHFYTIENLISTVFQGELQLATTSQTNFIPVDDFVVTETQDTKTTTTKGYVASCSLRITSRCLSCKKPVDTETSSTIIKCGHCSTKQKIGNTQTAKTLNLQLATQDGLQKFVIFDDVLNPVLNKNNLQNLSKDEIENHLLTIDNQVLVTHKPNSDIVQIFNIEPEQCETLRDN